jgi:hypothetical protein
VIHAKAFHKRYQKSKVDKHLPISCTCCQLSNNICGLLGALLVDRLGDKPVFKGEGTLPWFRLGPRWTSGFLWPKLAAGSDEIPKAAEEGEEEQTHEPVSL